MDTAVTVIIDISFIGTSFIDKENIDVFFSV